MSGILFVAVIVAAALAVLVKITQMIAQGPKGYPYQKSRSLFSPAERSFYGVLQQAVGEHAAIFGKVRVSDVVEPRKGLHRGAWRSAFKRISGKHFDFLLCDKEKLSLICAIELDDRSHQSKSRYQRDGFLKGVCEAGYVPLIQVPAKSGYVIEEVKQLIAPYLAAIDTPAQVPLSEPASREAESTEKVCPKCSPFMVKRVAIKGTHAGEKYGVCSAFPKCRSIESINA
jgi:hypothetical protein